MDKELNLDLNEQRFLLLLEQLIGETEKLQNNPPHLIPQGNSKSFKIELKISL
jgi:hypothetical protein